MPKPIRNTLLFLSLVFANILVQVLRAAVEKWGPPPIEALTLADIRFDIWLATSCVFATVLLGFAIMVYLQVEWKGKPK